MAVSVALLLLAGTTAGVAAADQGGRLADSPAARVASAPAGLDSLLPANQLAPTGPAQWYMPWLTGGAGSNYLGQGGWRSYMPFYGPFGPYPTLQGAAFFGATNSPLDPFTTLQLTNLLALQNGTGSISGSLSGFGPLASLTRTGLAPLASADLNQLQTLGISTAGLSAFFLPQGQNLNNVTLGQLVGAVPLVQLGGQGGFGGLGGFPFGFGTGVGTVTGTVTGP
jgi:hypothetical protein